ncbi:DUF2252 domain-containing protein [Marinicrinis sediminis]|uniref:DUF2252 domain-containing protein n=1 Tax=Marinicrinis sediminis TaxID=1652465 RepID=A0ABW5RF50_9BACL
MVYYAPERIKQTRMKLRRQALHTILEEFDRELMQLSHEKRMNKYIKMAENPFRFFRGSAYLFYYDVTRTPFIYHTPPECPTWIQGDLHFENFGGFRSEAGDMVYDVNDFDEGYLGSYLYDILRMSASIVLVAELHGFSDQEQDEAITTYLKAYVKQMQRFGQRLEDPSTLQFTEDNTNGPIRKVLRKLKQRQQNHLLTGITSSVEHHRQFVHTDELHPVSPEERVAILKQWEQYVETIDPELRQDEACYRIKDMAVKHGSGTASIGLDRYYLLIEGGETLDAQDDVILEMKEVRAPIPAFLLPHNESFWEQFLHQGARVITTQKAMHHEADAYLGYTSLADRHFYIRERSPYKKRVKADRIKHFKGFTKTLHWMGKITAKIHARADADLAHGLLDYHSEDEILKAIGDDVNSFYRRISLWSRTYASQIHEDYDIFCDWLNTFEQEEKPSQEGTDA